MPPSLLIVGVVSERAYLIVLLACLSLMPIVSSAPLKWLVVSSQKKSRARWWIAIAVFLLVIAVVVVAGLFWTAAHRYEVQAAETPETTEAQPLLDPANSDTGEQAKMPNVQAAVDKTSKDPALGELTAEVTDLASGQTVWAKDEGKLRTPASVTKVVTTAAATVALDDEDRLETYVVQQRPGELILVGEGDITLSSEPGSGFFSDAPSMRQLAEAIRPQIKNQKIDRIVVDNSVREGDLFNDTWDPADIPGGNVTNLDSVMLNAARISPMESYSPRSENPAKDAANVLAAQLGLDGVDVKVENATAATPMTASTRGNAKDSTPEGVTWLGGVESAPLHTRIHDTLVHSDNLLAETIAREVAESAGKPRTFAGATEATLQILKEHGVDLEGAVLKDNSGMSTGNRLSAHHLDQVLSRPELHSLLEQLPVSAVEGTLVDRYAEGTGSEDSAGWVRAKTGTLSGVNTLAGSVTTTNGRVLTFAFLATGEDTDASRAALDRLANSLRSA